MNDPVGTRTRGENARNDGFGAHRACGSDGPALVLFWEMLWPRLAPLLVLAAFFVGLSWLGVWREVGDVVRFAIARPFCGRRRGHRLSRHRHPVAAAGRPRLPGSKRRPARSTGRRPPFPTGWRAAPAIRPREALWAAHRTRLLAALDRLRAGSRPPALPVAIPMRSASWRSFSWSWRSSVAGPERRERLTEAFRGGEPVAATIARIDAWVTPPAYTSRPPIFLTGEAARPQGSEYSVPTGSVVTVRAGGANDLDVVALDATGNEIARDRDDAATRPPTARHRPAASAR